MDDKLQHAKESASAVSSTLDKKLGEAAAAAKSGLASATAEAQHLLSHGQQWMDTAEAHGQQALAHLEAWQDEAFGVLKEGIEYCILHPYISYPAAATLVLGALPGVRRFAYRNTLGRLRNPEAVVSSAEAKLSTLGAKAEEFGAESKKLQERAQLAYEEWTRGHQKLRAARQELQRLEASVGKSERLAGNVLADLRGMRQNPRATELRSEAALKLSLLQQQRAALAKEIKWISKQDV